MSPPITPEEEKSCEKTLRMIFIFVRFPPHVYFPWDTKYSIFQLMPSNNVIKRCCFSLQFVSGTTLKCESSFVLKHITPPPSTFPNVSETMGKKKRYGEIIGERNCQCRRRKKARGGGKGGVNKGRRERETEKRRRRNGRERGATEREKGNGCCWMPPSGDLWIIVAMETALFTLEIASSDTSRFMMACARQCSK